MESRTVLSCCLSNILDGMGFSQTAIAWRRKEWKCAENLLNIQELILDTTYTMYYSGSRMEGVGSDDLGSDIDKMQCKRDIRAIYYTAEWEFNPNLLTYLVDISNVHIGYCRLVRMNKHEPTFLKTAVDLHYIPILDGRLALSNQVIKPSEFQYSHGPALTSKIHKEVDNVLCIHCEWPPAAREWLKRKRSKNFPPRDVILSAEQRGAHVVPVGYKYSQFPNIEWRFSFSLLECQIMSVMSTAALKCYIVLKLLKKEMTKTIPDLPDLLSSYHIKTILFWLVEETGIEYWSEHRLLECIELLTNRLIECLLHGEIPHYFLRENNLLDSRITEAQKTQIITFLLQINSDRLQLFQTCFSILYSTARNLGDCRPEIQRLISYFRAIHCVRAMQQDVLKNVASRDSATFLRKVNTAVAQLTSLSGHCDPDIDEILKYLVDYFRQMCGSCLLSQLAGIKLPNTACFRLFSVLDQLVRCGPDRNGKLTLANFYYKTGKYSNALDVLNDVLRSNRNLSVRLINFRKGKKKLSVTQEQWDCLTSFSLFSLIRRHTISEYEFSLGEVNITPHGLKYEMFKRLPRPVNALEEKNCDFRRKNVFIDPDALAYYLEYQCYRRMGQRAHEQVAFSNLKWIASEESTLERQTSLNLLGHVYLEKGDTRKAVSCFVKSYNIEPKFTTALLHIALAIKRSLAPK